MLRLIMSKQNKRKIPPHPKSYYPLEEVKQKIQDGDVVIRENAQKNALKDFGWGKQDIYKMYMMLGKHHFYKSETSKLSPLIVIDHYKAHLSGEDIYTHFYIDDYSNKLVINSFKQDTKGRL